MWTGDQWFGLFRPTALQQNSRYNQNDIMDSAEGRTLALDIIPLNGTKNALLYSESVLNTPASPRQVSLMALTLWMSRCVKSHSLESQT